MRRIHPGVLLDPLIMACYPKGRFAGPNYPHVLSFSIRSECPAVLRTPHLPLSYLVGLGRGLSMNFGMWHPRGTRAAGVLGSCKKRTITSFEKPVLVWMGEGDHPKSKVTVDG